MTAAPHDALFKATFSQVERAAEELRWALPPELVAQIDFESLALEPGSFVDDALREQHTDLLYSLRVAGRAARVYVLFEHQSSVDPWMPLRLLRYMLRVWEACASEGTAPLPVIVPVVLHHSDTGWRAATSFEALFDLPPATAGFTPHFRFVLDDLGAHGEAALQERAVSACTRLVLSALQQARSGRDLAQLLRGWSGLIRELARAPDGARALKLVFSYLFEVRGAAEFAAVHATVRDIDSEETMQTIAQMLESRGIEKGRRQMLLDMLQHRFGELPEAVRRRVTDGGDAELGRWSLQLLSAQRLEDVFV